MRILLIIALISTLAATAPANAVADIVSGVSYEVSGCDRGVICATILGTIHEGDAARLAEMAATAAKKYPMPRPNSVIVELDSRGGSVAEAMQIGRLLRVHHGVAMVQPDATCASACVFVLMGATQRQAYGKVAIHRPYPAVAEDISFEERQRIHKVYRDQVLEYLDEMNIPRELFTAMEDVPPEKVRVLNAHHKQSYRLDVDDPVEQEDQAALEARYYGLTMQEYYRKKAKAESTCPDGNTEQEVRAFGQCRADVLRGER